MARTESIDSESLNRETWERAEIERSAREAAGIDQGALRFTASNIARYIAPPANTPHPLEYAYHLLGDARGKVALDLGCGAGENAVMLALRGARVKAVDISPELLQVAEHRLAANAVTSGVGLFVGSAYDLPLADESVDVVFGIAILHHLDLETVAREVRRVLRPGGRGIFQEPIRNSALVRRVRALIPYRHPDVSPFERPLTDHEIGRFASHFFRGRARAFFLPHVSVANRLRVSGRPLHVCYRLDRWLLRTFPTLTRFATIKVFELEK
jgi:SAM-dependent methyltransferase